MLEILSLTWMRVQTSKLTRLIYAFATFYLMLHPDCIMSSIPVYRV